MALGIEGVLDGGMGRQETLGRSRRLEPLHLPLPTACGLVRVLGPVVSTLPLVVASRETELAYGRAIGPELVGGDGLRRETLFPDQLAQKPDSRGLVPSRLHQDVEHFTFVVHRPPEPTPLACDPYYHFVQVPPSGRTWSPLPQLPGEQRAELGHPAPDSFIGDVECRYRRYRTGIPI